MHLTQFIKYLEQHLSNLEMLETKFYEFQVAKNDLRKKANKLSYQQVRTASDKMYSGALITLYNNISDSLGKQANSQEKWIEKLQGEGFLETIDASFEELDLFDK